MNRYPLRPTRNPPQLALLAGLVATALCCASAPASAALGDTVASVSNDSAQLKASQRVIAGARYTVHELLTPAGTTIREYSAPDGTVFAVAWRGPFKPDMRVLLGGYFDTYALAPRSAGSNRAHLSIDQQDLVVRAGGHMRAFEGMAWAPGLVPAGVAPGELQ